MASSDAYAVGALAIGGLFLYSAIANKKVLSATQNLVRGQSPALAASGPATVLPAGSTTGTGQAPGTTTAAGRGSGGVNIFSHASAAALWISAGGNPAAANNAACHAMQESSGDPFVTSRNPDGGTNVGLWQLDTPGGKGAGYSVLQLQNPFTNARVAIKGSSNGSDWSAWATPGC